MPSVNIYSILQAILEAIDPGNRAVPYSLFPARRAHFCSPARRHHRHNNLHKIIHDTVSDEAVEKLSTLFSEQLLLAALDLIDRDCGKETLTVLPSFSKKARTYDNDTCSGQVHFAVGSKPLFRPRDNGLLHHFSEPASILFHPVFLHMPGLLLRRAHISFADHGACAYSNYLFIFWLRLGGVLLSPVQTRPGHADCSALIEMRCARGEQRRVCGPHCTTDLGHVGNKHNREYLALRPRVQQII
jgi:hypothetical protein